MAELCQDDDEARKPALGSIELALSIARGPAISQPESVLNKSVLRIGSKEVNQEEGIEFPIRHSKATSKAMPMSLKKVIASELLPPSRVPKSSYGAGASQSQSQAKPVPQTASAGIEADVTPFKRYTVMVPKNKSEMGDMDVDDIPIDATKVLETQDDGTKEEIEYEEREVEEENLVKAYKFGKTWVPMPKDIFPDMETDAGMDVLGFMKASGVSRHTRGTIFIVTDLINRGLLSCVDTRRWVRSASSGPSQTTTTLRSRSRPWFKLCYKRTS
jgi:ATP-dependent DNA helicase 2 subunit 2